jgi:anti-sigma B factor antagonist
MPKFSIEATESDRLIVHGDIDLSTAPRLAEALSTRGPNLDLDLGDCTFMDSSGISVLVHARSSEVPGLRITHVSAIVRRVLTLCGLAEILIDEDRSAPST